MSYVPKPFMGRDQTFLGTAIPPGREVGRSPDHEIQDTQQLPGGLDIPLVAGMVKRNQDLVGQAPGVAWFWGGCVGRWVGHNCGCGRFTAHRPVGTVIVRHCLTSSRHFVLTSKSRNEKVFASRHSTAIGRKDAVRSVNRVYRA
jgi:hypothetical protein